MAYESIEALHEDIRRCAACPLRAGCTQVVPGEGNPQADILFIGEGPGADEDAQGRPFVGRAGQLLDRMLDAIDLSRQDVFIANVVKCRPPGNRNPTDAEARVCLNWLRQQVRLIRPRILVCLGTVAARHIMDPEARISQIRGKFIEQKGFTLFATYHPAALLRDERLKVDVWRDLQALRRRITEEGL